ncbi:MAG: xanthine dehydrogenase family protein subunit M [Chloroflexi bacterium]|nr:xanthine dehydrogenase family protein subunit M [Chloroflexota bacterium]
MGTFRYAAPNTLDEALSALAAPGESRPLAGGTDLIDQLRTGRRGADVVVDLKLVPELQRMVSDDRGLHIGAARSCTDVRDHAQVARQYQGLFESAGLIGSIQIQNRAAIGGNVCNAAPSADIVPALLVHDAIAVIASKKGKREVPLAGFFVGPGKTVLEKGQILLELILPAPAPNSASAYLRFIPRNEMDIAVAGVGSYLELDPATRIVKRARIALAAVAPTPVRARMAEMALEGREINDALIDAASGAAVQAARPITDVRGSADYRKELVQVLTRRTLRTCVERILS